MKPEKSNPTLLTAKILDEGSAALFYGPKKIAVVTPELFIEGWVKNTARPSPKGKAPQGLVKLPDGLIGLKTTVKFIPKGLEVRVVVMPLSDVKLIHVRQVVNLPYKDWAGKAFEFGKKKGVIPQKTPADIKMAEGKTKALRLGPHPLLGGKTLKIQAPGLHLVLQDNRQWTPFLHAFVTRGEASDPAWVWKKGRKKEYRIVFVFA